MRTRPFRITASRRDFLRLCTKQDLRIRDRGKRFLVYKIAGQISHKISGNNFAAIVGAGYLCLVGEDAEGWQTWRATDKARSIFHG